MTHKDIDSYADLQRFIQFQLHSQITTTKKSATIKLNKVWFFKTIKLIQFTLKNDVAEEDSRRPINEEWTSFKVICNGYKTTFRIYDL